MADSFVIALAIPCRNGASYLGNTLASLAENRPHLRWWMQDACSDDGSLEIARSYQGGDDRVVSEPDGGQADALNRAFSRMGGSVLGFLNADDVLVEGAAEVVLRHFADHPEVDLIYGKVAWIDAAGAGTGIHWGEIGSLEEILNIYEVWWNRRHWVQPEVFFRRSLWERVGPFDNRYHYAFDFDYWVRCFEAGARVARMDRVLARFRVHPEQKSSNREAAAREIRDVVSRALDRVGDRLPSGFRRKLERRLSYDRYQAGQDQAGVPLAMALWKRPDWFLLPEVRERVGKSLGKRAGQGSRCWL